MKTLSRRDFGKLAVSGALGSTVIATTGFSCGSVWNAIASYVPVAIQSFDQILALIDPAEAAALSVIIVAVKASFADLAADVSAYENAPADQKVTWEQKITLGINIAIGNLQQFWNDANLPDGSLAATISGVLTIILSTLAAFLPLVGGTLTMGRKLAKSLPVNPQKRSRSQFASAVNAVFTQHGYSNRVY